MNKDINDNDKKDFYLSLYERERDRNNKLSLENERLKKEVNNLLNELTEIKRDSYFNKKNIRGNSPY